MSEPKVSEVKGTIVLEDGSTSEFSIGKDFGWSQWGAVRERLSQTVEVLDAMVVGFQQEEVRFVSDYDEPEDEDDEDEDEDGEATDADLIGPLFGADLEEPNE